jgi:DNA processing protein
LENQLLAQLTLIRVKGIGPVYTKLLVRRFGDAEAVLAADRTALESTGLPRKQVHGILHASASSKLQNELRYLRRNDVRTLFFTDPDYPQQLNKIGEAPALLFYRGNVALNGKKIVAIAGTRSPTDYGTSIIAGLIRDIAAHTWPRCDIISRPSEFWEPVLGKSIPPNTGGYRV